jgi:hypothetical protein
VLIQSDHGISMWEFQDDDDIFVYRVKGPNIRTRTFHGETAWADAERYYYDSVLDRVYGR